MLEPLLNAHVNTPDPSDTEYDRIARHLSGEGDELERAEFERALADPGLRARFEAAAADWQSASLRTHVDVDQGWARLQARLASATPDASNVVSFPTRAPWWRQTGSILRFAAAATLVVGAGYVWSRTRAPAGVAPAVATAGLHIVTSAGERRSVELPDGSVVQLAPASSIRTLDQYGAPLREVELVGEASFQVTHDEARPFRVRTAGALIEDLGTVFVVRAIDREPVRVAVSEGSVSVRAASRGQERQVVLQPRDVALVADTGDVVVSRGVDVEPYAAWTSGRLVFRNTPLREAIVDLERWYDVAFEVSDAALLARPIDVTFEGQSIDEVIQVMGTALSVRFERSGRTVSVVAPVRTGLVGQPAAQVGDGA